MGERVTIYDIAREAGTSTSTVSRVLNGSALVPGPTSRAVLDVAARLGYAPRRIRRHASRAMLNIVLFLPHAERPQTHLFYDAATLISGIQEGLGDLRAQLIVSLSDSTDALTTKKLGDIDGCIFAFTSPEGRVRNFLAERQLPTVLINRTDAEFGFVTNDVNAGITSLRAEISRRRPGEQACFVAVENAGPVARYRTEALTGSGGAQGVSQLPSIHWFPTVVDISVAAVEELYESGCRVFMCVNDYVAIAVSDRLGQMGLHAPADVGLTGYDAAPVRALFTRGLTSVDLCVGALGREAADALGSMIVDRSSERVRRYVTGELLPGDTL